MIDHRFYTIIVTRRPNPHGVRVTVSRQWGGMATLDIVDPTLEGALAAARRHIDADDGKPIGVFVP